MIRFKPGSASSAMLTCNLPELEVWLWVCGCRVVSDPTTMILRPCTSDDCIREAETPFPPPKRKPDYRRYCMHCWWEGGIEGTGTYFAPGEYLHDDDDPGRSEDVCPRCRRTVYLGPGTVKVAVDVPIRFDFGIQKVMLHRRSGIIPLYNIAFRCGCRFWLDGDRWHGSGIRGWGDCTEHVDAIVTSQCREVP